MPEPTNPDLRKLLAEATARPWEVSQRDRTYIARADCGDDEEAIALLYQRRRDMPERKRRNAALIVAAVNSLPAILDFVDAVRRFSDSGDCGRALEGPLAALDAVINRSEP